MYVGFLTRSNNPTGLCMPCCFIKDPFDSNNKAKKSFNEKCIGVGSTTTSDNFPTSGTTNNYTNLILQPNSGNVVIGVGSSLATTATNGFLCIPTCAGAPTVGPPTGPEPAVPVGTVPLIYDTTNNRLYIRTPSGTWRYGITTT
jgi:hypothetical protein